MTSRWFLAAPVLIVSLIPAAARASTASDLMARAFRMPEPEAIGAVLGAVVAANAYAWYGRLKAEGRI